MTEHQKVIIEQCLFWKEVDFEIGDDLFIYKSDYEHHSLLLRLNDFPDEPLYTLYIDEVPVVNVESWPEHWKK